MIGEMLLIVGLLVTWTSDGIRDGFHIAQVDQRTWHPDTQGGIVDYGNYHDYVLYETVSVATAGTGAYLWSKQNPEWWRVTGVVAGTSLMGWLVREWTIDYIPTGDPFRTSEPWQSQVFGTVSDNALAFQIGVGALGAGMTAAALLWPSRSEQDRWLNVSPTPSGVNVAVNF